MTLIDVPEAEADPIDAVITWVNGNTETHRRKRARYMADAGASLLENAINPHRWNSDDEILYCLQSIENFAPWTRTIWIVLDSDPPDLSRLSDALRAKIRFVDHHDIFGAFSAVLPTFNSLSIESMIWRIEGLSDRFMYFNDDVFLSAPLAPEDVFLGPNPVLRGKWVDYTAVLDAPEMRHDPAKFHHFMHINAAKMVGFEASRLFASAHVVHPLRRSVMAQLFDQHADAFVENIKYRFRDLNQFLPQGLHNHACIVARTAVVQSAQDHLHIKSGHGNGRPPDETWAKMRKAIQPGVKFVCVNDLPQLEILIPDLRVWLCDVVGGFPGVAQSGPR
ncbi:MAG: Stealth CR1 domain-containing protein [Marivita sp.]|uniref:Stealth CR1 domain-containing protein n=1 Tax=Marivita sp. TaxID=2003365 RepID=UPI003EF1BAE3